MMVMGVRAVERIKVTMKEISMVGRKVVQND
jgi:hypothetical protein